MDRSNRQGARMTDEEIIENAHNELSAICKGKKFQMRIPADETDSDLIIAKAIGLARAKTEECEKLRELVRSIGGDDKAVLGDGLVE